jgi:hypothetical protein
MFIFRVEAKSSYFMIYKVIKKDGRDFKPL